MDAGLLDKLVQMVLGGERDGDQRRAGGSRALAHPVEGGFELVDESGDLVEPEHGARALDGVERAEGAINEIAVVGVLFEIKQRLFEALQQVACFLAECFRGIG